MCRCAGRNFRPQQRDEAERLVAGEPIYYGLDGQPRNGVPFHAGVLYRLFGLGRGNDQRTLQIAGVEMSAPQPPEPPEPEPEPAPEPEPEPLYEACEVELPVGGSAGDCQEHPDDAGRAIVPHGTCLTDCHAGYERGGGAVECNDGYLRYVNDSSTEWARPKGVNESKAWVGLRLNSTAEPPFCVPPETRAQVRTPTKV